MLLQAKSFIKKPILLFWDEATPAKVSDRGDLMILA
jgi:hypothetical protein